MSDDKLRSEWVAGHAIVADWPSIGGTQRVMCADYVDAELARLRAEIAAWHKLRDPANLHTSLLRGFPAQLSRATYLHLAGDAPAQEPPA